jgi:hypothetical protein
LLATVSLWRWLRPDRLDGEPTGRIHEAVPSLS